MTITKEDLGLRSRNKATLTLIFLVLFDLPHNIFSKFGKYKGDGLQRCMVFEEKSMLFFGKWTLNLGKTSDHKRHIQDGSSKF